MSQQFCPRFQPLLNWVTCKVIILCFSSEAMDEKERLQLCCDAFKAHLTSLNEAIMNNEVADHIESAIKSVQNGARYERLDPKGPKHPKVTKKCPITTK